MSIFRRPWKLPQRQCQNQNGPRLSKSRQALRLVDGAFISAQISADLAKLTAILDRVDADLADAIRRDIITAKQAAIEEDIALILLLAS